MTNEEAIEYGKRWDRAIESRGDTSFSEARQFLNLAIKALEGEKQGEWIDHTATQNLLWGQYECPFCHKRSNRGANYCQYCGAKNVKEAEENA